LVTFRGSVHGQTNEEKCKKTGPAYTRVSQTNSKFPAIVSTLHDQEKRILSAIEPAPITESPSCFRQVG
jgi:hypothetical protein